MRKPLIVVAGLWLFLTGAAPSRVFTYTAGQVISPSEVTSNEDAIFAYLQAGVDTLATGSVTSTAILDGTISSADLGSAAITSATITDGTIVNADVSTSAAIAYSKLATLTSGNILVGSSGNVATSVAMSGDVTISNTGVTAVGSNTVALTTDTTGNYAAGDAEAGAATSGDSATAFFSSGTIEHERGGLEGNVSAYDGLIGITGGAVYNQTGTTTQIIIFDGSGAPTSAALSGDVTMTNGGVVTIADNSVDGTDIAFGSDAAGDTYYYDGTNVVRLAKGTAGQVLEMNAGATAPEWDTDNGGAWEFVETLTLSGTSTTSSTLPTTTNMMLLVLENVIGSGAGLAFRVNADGGTNYDYIVMDPDAASTIALTTGASLIRLCGVTGRPFNGTILFGRPNVAAAHWFVMNLASNNLADPMAVRGRWATDDAITTVNFSDTSSTSGTVHIYRAAN